MLMGLILICLTDSGMFPPRSLIEDDNGSDLKLLERYRQSEQRKQRQHWPTMHLTEFYDWSVAKDNTQESEQTARSGKTDTCEVAKSIRRISAGGVDCAERPRRWGGFRTCRCCTGDDTVHRTLSADSATNVDENR